VSIKASRTLVEDSYQGLVCKNDPLQVFFIGSLFDSCSSKTGR
jgi:hypothetical protein